MTKEQVGIRMEPDTIRDLQDWARAEKRSLSSLINYIICQALEDRQQTYDHESAGSFKETENARHYSPGAIDKLRRKERKGCEDAGVPQKKGGTRCTCINTPRC